MSNNYIRGSKYLVTCKGCGDATGAKTTDADSIKSKGLCGLCADNQIDYDDEVQLGIQDYSDKGQGRKDDSAKIRYSLLPVGTVNQVVQVLEFGSKKYADNNWQKVPNAKTRYYDAAMRHIDAWWNGELLDLDKGDQKGSHLPHLAHAICCLMFLMWFDSE